MLINISFLTVSLAVPSSGELYHVAYSAERGGRTYITSTKLSSSHLLLLYIMYYNYSVIPYVEL